MKYPKYIDSVMPIEQERSLFEEIWHKRVEAIFHNRKKVIKIEK